MVDVLLILLYFAVGLFFFIHAYTDPHSDVKMASSRIEWFVAIFLEIVFALMWPIGVGLWIVAILIMPRI